MKPLVFALFIMMGYSCIAQTDSLLFHSFERIIKRDGGIGYNDEIFVAINKYDLQRLNLKDTTILNVVGRNFKLIVLKNPADKKDFYILPIEYHKDNYIRFKIQSCKRKTDNTFIISYVKNADNLFVLDDFEVAEPVKTESISSE